MGSRPVALTREEKVTLERLVRSSTAEQRQVFRARLILLASTGLAGNEVAKRLGCRSATVSKWRRRSWCISTDPEFASKAADIAGLFLHPPANAVVLPVDEKPHIQALERAQGWLKRPNGWAGTGYAHEYKRHGTSNLFAALNVVAGEVQAQHAQRRRRVEFLAFVNQVIARHGDRKIHVILDNLNIHKPKHDQ